MAKGKESLRRKERGATGYPPHPDNLLFSLRYFEQCHGFLGCEWCSEERFRSPRSASRVDGSNSEMAKDYLLIENTDVGSWVDGSNSEMEKD